MRTSFRRFVERVSAFRIYRHPPRGADIVHDIANDLPLVRVETIFDVGANLGQSASEYLRAYPAAKIYCFEPVSKTAENLSRRLGRRVKVEQIALGAYEGEAKMATDGPSETCRLIGITAAAEGGKSEVVALETIDGYCARNEIEAVNYLKIDTEGADVEVIKGAKDMLMAQKIDLVQVEAGLSPLHDWHIPFEILKKTLEGYDYHLFSIFEQTRNWHPGAPYLQWANPVFVSRKVIEAHREIYQG